jgi:hypothetical protein
MIGFKQTATVALLAGIAFTRTSQASLVALADGMVYDNVSHITWAADANLFQTQAASNPNLVSEIIAANNGVILSDVYYGWINGYDGSITYNLTSADFNTSTGGMSWWGAQAWVNNLTLGGYTDWIIPPAAPFGPGYDPNRGVIGRMFNQLGSVLYGPGYDITTTHNDNYNLFNNVRNVGYHQSAMYEELFSWRDFATYGYGIGIGSSPDCCTWAIREGNVSLVPVPVAVWLFGSGLIGLLSFNRRKNKTA